jgi:eukaryotic-like serine/threonine-protein kinase
MSVVRSIGSYEILRVLGEGGMGTVYLARDPIIGRLVAIKLIRPEIDSPALRARLSQEARAAGRLSHPNIVTIFHVDEDGGRPYIAMEYVAGQSLAALIRGHAPISLARKLLILERVCEGLACAHDAGLVHRDIKPANVIVDASFEPKIVDFGLAKLPDAMMALTREHDVLGTLSYISPEQLSNAPVDQRSDLFAVAAVAYELITLRRAFSGDTRQVIAQILGESPAQRVERDAEIDQRIAETLVRGLQRDPDHRFQNAREMGRAFHDARQQLTRHVGDSSVLEVAPIPATIVAPHANSGLAAPVERRWRRRLVPAVLVTLIAAAGVVALLNRDRPLDTNMASHASPTMPETTLPESRSPVPSNERARNSFAPTADAPRLTQPPPAPATSAAPAPNVVEHDERESQASAAPAGTTLGIGSVLLVSVATMLDSRRTGPGDRFVGVLDEPLMKDGREVVPVGARVEGRVEQSGIASGRPFIELSLTGLSIGGRLTPIRTGFYRAVAPAVERGPNFAAIVIGAAVGTTVGAAIGGGSGAIGGGILGTSAGAAASGDTPGPAEYRFGARVPFRIAEPVHIDTTQ